MIGVCMIDSTCEHAEATPNFSVDAISRSLLSKPLNAKYSQQTFVPLVSNNSKHTAFVSMYRGSLLCSVDLSETDKTWLSNSNWKIAPKVSNELVEEQCHSPACDNLQFIDECAGASTLNEIVNLNNGLVAGCSSLRDKFRTLTHRLTRFLCFVTEGSRLRK
eukprot:6193313-Pleurochrysis_carterae.AAC.1